MVGIANNLALKKVLVQLESLKLATLIHLLWDPQHPACAGSGRGLPLDDPTVGSTGRIQATQPPSESLALPTGFHLLPSPCEQSPVAAATAHHDTCPQHAQG